MAQEEILGYVIVGMTIIGIVLIIWGLFRESKKAKKGEEEDELVFLEARFYFDPKKEVDSRTINSGDDEVYAIISNEKGDRLYLYDTGHTSKNLAGVTSEVKDHILKKALDEYRSVMEIPNHFYKIQYKK